MNKRIFTICKCNYDSFALYLHYAKLLSYSTGLMQISNGAKLNMADGVYKDVRGAKPRHPCRLNQTWTWPSATWHCTTTTPASQPRTTVGHTEWSHKEVGGECRASWSRTPVASTPGQGFFILRFSDNLSTSLCRWDWPLGGGQLASHHKV
jgi:hypothetical protein